MTDHMAGVESRARCDAPHTKAKGPHARPERDPEAAFAKFVSAMFGPPVLQPGTKVRYRIPPKGAHGQDGPFVIMGVITERGMHGTSVRYRIGNGDMGGDGYEVAPELVEAVPEPAKRLAFHEEDVSAPLRDADELLMPEPRMPRYVEFTEISARLMESVCGRYRVTYSGERWSAFDVWTGETSPASMGRGPALEWVAKRASAPVPPLNWIDFPGGARVEHMGTAFEVFEMFGPKWKGFDPRFTAEAFFSPLFDTLGKAKEWVAVRAMCEAQPLPGGKGARPWLMV